MDATRQARELGRVVLEELVAEAARRRQDPAAPAVVEPASGRGWPLQVHRRLQRLAFALLLGRHLTAAVLWRRLEPVVHKRAVARTADEPAVAAVATGLIVVATAAAAVAVVAVVVTAGVAAARAAAAAAMQWPLSHRHRGS